jgi:hypothetical protein
MKEFMSAGGSPDSDRSDKIPKNVMATSLPKGSDPAAKRAASALQPRILSQAFRGS